MKGRMTRYGTPMRLARALLDYLSGVDPSAVELVGTLLTLIPRRAASHHEDHTAGS